MLPLLYLRGLSTGDFREALPALLGEDAVGLSPTAVTRLTAKWAEEYEAFRGRDLSGCDYVYIWVDGIHFNIRLEEDRLCTLVAIGVKADGTKELVAEDGTSSRRRVSPAAIDTGTVRGRGGPTTMRNTTPPARRPAVSIDRDADRGRTEPMTPLDRVDTRTDVDRGRRLRGADIGFFFSDIVGLGAILRYS